MLQLKDVTISHKNEPTVEHFNLNMKQGQIVSLVGESGSGKTTVIRAILGLLAGGGKVSEGSVLFENQDLLSYTNEQWRKLRGTQISMIFQDSGAMMNPTRKVGKVFTEYILTHEKISKKRSLGKRMRDVRTYEPCESGQCYEFLSISVIRWYETESRNCNGDDLSAQTPFGR